MSDEDYRRQLYSGYSAHFSGFKADAPEIQFRQYEQCYPQLPQSRAARILDAGCGKGEWLNWLHGKGYTDLWGFDLSDSDIQAARANPALHIEEGDAATLLAGRKFDLIHAKDFIEHLAPGEVLAFLRSCREALNPGGEIWILTFNAQSPFSAATRYGDFTHRVAFTPLSMMQVLAATGLPTVEIRGLHVTPRTLKGLLRKLVWAVCTPFFRLLLKARHGVRRSPGVDLFSTDPDIFAIARAK